MNIVYKVFAKKGKNLYSARANCDCLPTNKEAFFRFYRGEVNKAPFGGFFCFETFLAAKDFCTNGNYHYFGKDEVWTVAVSGRISLPNVGFSDFYESTKVSSLIDYWNGELNNLPLSQADFPKGTVIFEELIPLRYVTSFTK